MKRTITQLDATPTKNIYSSIIVDYDLKLAVCELIDNVIDTITRNKISRKVKVDIEFDVSRSQMIIKDNASGVHKEDLVKLISPGQSGNDATDNTIGIFGVGSKRAVVALAERIEIKSQVDSDKAYGFTYDQGWLEESDWLIDLFETDSIGKNTTQIKMNTLRFQVNDDEILELMIHLSEVYSRYIQKGELLITVNREKVEASAEQQWSYPSGYEPKEFYGVVMHGENEVHYSIVGGLSTKSSPKGEYGITYYCNDRLVIKNLNTPQVGFVGGVIGNIHPNASLANVVVSMKGPAESMPWNSSKSALNYNHELFPFINEKTTDLMKYYASLSRKNEGRWKEDIFVHTKGKIEKIEDQNKKKLSNYLLGLPRTRNNYHELVEKNNRKLEKNKPYVKGIHETVSMIPRMKKFPIRSKSRLILIVLDSTLEIAFKEYLIYESEDHYNDEKLNTIMKSRHKVHTEIKKIFGNKIDWTRLQYFYNIRNQLVHQRATVAIDESEIEEFENIAKETLHILFGSEFE